MSLTSARSAGRIRRAGVWCIANSRRAGCDCDGRAATRPCEGDCQRPAGHVSLILPWSQERSDSPLRCLLRQRKVCAAQWRARLDVRLRHVKHRSRSCASGNSSPWLAQKPRHRHARLLRRELAGHVDEAAHHRDLARRAVERSRRSGSQPARSRRWVTRSRPCSAARCSGPKPRGSCASSVTSSSSRRPARPAPRPRRRRCRVRRARRAATAAA